MARQSNLVSAPIATTLLAFALPTLASSVLQSANGSIDTVWVGRLIGGFADVYGFLLGMVGVASLILFLSIVSSMKAVTG